MREVRTNILSLFSPLLKSQSDCYLHRFLIKKFGIIFNHVFKRNLDVFIDYSKKSFLSFLIE